MKNAQIEIFATRSHNVNYQSDYMLKKLIH